jgi:purine-binding chemotaxis protein CheW
MAENKGRTHSKEDLDDDEEDEDTQKDKFLTFTVGKEDYGLEIYHVTEIIGIQKITEIPDMPDYVKGVINLRGKVIPIMDLRKRFKFEERAYDDRTCIVVVNINNTSLGLVVDMVKEVYDIPEKDIQPPPEIAEGNRQFFIRGLGKVEDDVKILLDAEKLLSRNDLSKVSSAASTQA